VSCFVGIWQLGWVHFFIAFDLAIAILLAFAVPPVLVVRLPRFYRAIGSASSARRRPVQESRSGYAVGNIVASL
jgi:hypothetical protein